VTPWVERVNEVIRSIPKGRTLGYAQVALLAGKPGAARAVVRALHAIPKGAPWWRVTRSDRTLADPVRAEQRRRLSAEGVKFEQNRVPASCRWGG
jgi:methylated-DNA-protein-cysteine methyltransferase-like protein